MPRRFRATGHEARADGMREEIDAPPLTAVQKLLRETIRRIEADFPELARHLDESIRTGLFCGYLPDRRRRLS
jgi:hypothetical protein